MPGYSILRKFYFVYITASSIYVFLFFFQKTLNKKRKMFENIFNDVVVHTSFKNKISKNNSMKIRLLILKILVHGSFTHMQTH